MSELILKEDGSPFATIESAKSKRTRMGKAGLDTNVVAVEGGYALEKTRYEKPRKRIPLGKRNILTVTEEKDPSYNYRFVNDEPGRIKMFRDAGWEVVEKRGGMQIGDPQAGLSEQVGSIVTKSVGGGKVAYLMRIKKEFYEEDQELKAASIRELESGLKMEETKNPNKDGRYGKVEIQEKKTQRR
jgi:hypothetical protein